MQTNLVPCMRLTHQLMSFLVGELGQNVLAHHMLAIWMMLLCRWTRLEKHLIVLQMITGSAAMLRLEPGEYLCACVLSDAMPPSMQRLYEPNSRFVAVMMCTAYTVLFRASGCWHPAYILMLQSLGRHSFCSSTVDQAVPSRKIVCLPLLCFNSPVHLHLDQ